MEGEFEGKAADTPERTTRSAEISIWQKAIAHVQAEPNRWPTLLHWLASEDRPKLDEAVLVYVETTAESLDSERLHTLRAYSTMLHRQLGNLQYEFSLLLPWQLVWVDPPALLTTSDLPAPLAKVLAKVRSTLPHDLTLQDAAIRYHDLAAVVVQLQAEVDALAAQTSHDAAVVARIAETSAWCQRLAEVLQTTHIAARRVSH